MMRRRYCDQNEVVGGAYSTFGKMGMQEVLAENLKVRDHLKDLSRDGKLLR
jgi:IS1 family transposase